MYTGVLLKKHECMFLPRRVFANVINQGMLTNLNLRLKVGNNENNTFTKLIACTVLIQYDD